MKFKPCLRCRSDVRLWHTCYLLLIYALTAMSLRRPTVARLSFTFQYKPFMWCRLDARLRHDYLFVYLSRRHSRHSIGLQLFVGISGGLPPDFLFTYHVMQIFFIWMSIVVFLMTHSCMHLLYLMSELSCVYFQSTHLACWFGQMLMKAISWMKSSIASPMPRGVSVSPVRSWIWSL